MADGRFVAYEPQSAPRPLPHAVEHLGAAVTHTGFEALTFRGKPILFMGSFHHQLHHRYYDCNYGNPYMPWDRWLGSNHDGTPQALADLQRRRRERLRPRDVRS